MPASIIPPPGQPSGSPNITAEIDLSAAFVFAAGQTDYTNSLESLFDNAGLQTGFFSFTNNGSLWNIQSGDASILDAFNFGPIVNTGLAVAESTAGQVQTFV